MFMLSCKQRDYIHWLRWKSSLCVIRFICPKCVENKGEAAVCDIILPWCKTALKRWVICERNWIDCRQLLARKLVSRFAHANKRQIPKEPWIITSTVIAKRTTKRELFQEMKWLLKGYEAAWDIFSVNFLVVDFTVARGYISEYIELEYICKFHDSCLVKRAQTI